MVLSISLGLQFLAAATFASEQKPQMAVENAGSAALSRFEIARLLFSGGYLTHAKGQFEALWMDSTIAAAEGNPRHCFAFYLAMIADRQGDAATYRQWLQRAKSCCDSQAQMAFYDHYSSQVSGPIRQHIPNRNTRISLTRFVAKAPNASPDHQQSLEAYRELVVKARLGLVQDASLENRIRLMSSLLLYAELAADPSETLFTTANDNFDEGLQLYQKIETEIENDEGLETKISQMADVALRLDAVRARMNRIQKVRDLARAEEKNRLDDLRKLVKLYSACTGELAHVQAQILMDDFAAAQAVVAQVEKHYQDIKDVVEARQERDYYLMTDEPDPNKDQQIPYVPVPPFTKTFASQLAALDGFLKLRLATRAGRTDEILLAKALEKAQHSVHKAPDGDPDNVLGHYVLALAHERKGLLATQGQPFQSDAHRAAKADFDEARTRFNRTLELLSLQLQPAMVQWPLWPRSSLAAAITYQPQETSITRFTGDVIQRLEALRGHQVYLPKAKELTLAGQTTQAFQHLSEGLARHPAPDLWIAWAQAGPRAGEDESKLLTAWDKAAASGILPADDVRVSLTRAKVFLSGTLRKMGAQSFDAIPADERQRLASDLDSTLKTLNGLREIHKNDSLLEARLNAYAALATVFRIQLDPRAVVKEETLKVYEQAMRAFKLLTTSLEQVDELELREDVIAVEFALGHLAIQTQANYRNTALQAFHAALDAQAKLPFRGTYSMLLGTPLLQAINSRPENADLRLVQEEQGLRRSLQHFVGGAIALQYGNPTDASKLMNLGLEQLDISATAPTSTRHDAAKLLGLSDDVDATVYSKELLQTFQVLSRIAAREHYRALADALAMVDPTSSARDVTVLNDSKTQEVIQDAVRKIKSPLAGYALGRALEEVVGAQGIQSFPDRKFLLERAKEAQKRTDELLTTEIRRRYPVFVTLRNEAAQRLESPEFFLTEAARLRSEFRLGDTAKVLLEGLARHPQASALWRKLIQVRIDQIDATHHARRPVAQDQFREVRGLMDKLKELVGSDSYESLLWKSHLEELSGNAEVAVTSLRNAEAMATETADQIQVSTRSALLDAQMRLRANSRP